MERKNIQSVGDVLRNVIAENEMSGRLDELRAAEFWPFIVGPDLARQTMRPYVKNGLMTIRVPDAALRQELSMHRSAMVRELNRLSGTEAIKDIRFIS